MLRLMKFECAVPLLLQCVGIAKFCGVCFWFVELLFFVLRLVSFEFLWVRYGFRFENVGRWYAFVDTFWLKYGFLESCEFYLVEIIKA